MDTCSNRSRNAGPGISRVLDLYLEDTMTRHRPLLRVAYMDRKTDHWQHDHTTFNRRSDAERRLTTIQADRALPGRAFIQVIWDDRAWPAPIKAPPDPDNEIPPEAHGLARVAWGAIDRYFSRSRPAQTNTEARSGARLEIDSDDPLLEISKRDYLIKGLLEMTNLFAVNTGCAVAGRTNRFGDLEFRTWYQGLPSPDMTTALMRHLEPILLQLDWQATVFESLLLVRMRPAHPKR